MQIRVGVELPGDEVLDFARSGGVDVCEAVDLGIGVADGFSTAGSTLDYDLGCLADDEGEGKNEVIVVGEFEEKGGAGGGGSRVGILANRGERLERDDWSRCTKSRCKWPRG